MPVARLSFRPAGQRVKTARLHGSCIRAADRPNPDSDMRTSQGLYTQLKTIVATLTMGHVAISTSGISLSAPDHITKHLALSGAPYTID